MIVVLTAELKYVNENYSPIVSAPFVLFFLQYAVYHALPFTTLDPVVPPFLSENVQKILQSKAAKQKEAEDLMPKIPKRRANEKKLAYIVKCE